MNSTPSYRDDSSAKPPWRSLTLQNKTPLTKGTDDNSSKSKSTLNLNLFFFIRMNDMMPEREGTGHSEPLTEVVKLTDRLSLRCAHACSVDRLWLSLLLLRSVCRRRDSKFKSPPSHPLTKIVYDAGESPTSHWTLKLRIKISRFVMVTNLTFYRPRLIQTPIVRRNAIYCVSDTSCFSSSSYS